MQNPNPKSVQHDHNQVRLLLAHTHRVVQCEMSTDDLSAVDRPLHHPQPPNTAPLGRWQRLLQQLKKMLVPALFAATALLVPQTQARDVSISVQSHIQPGVYGQVQRGSPSVIVYSPQVHARPVYVKHVDVNPAYAQPIYAQPYPVYIQPVLVQAPKKHRKHWKKYCHHYGACQHRIQFVDIDYRPRHDEKVYVYQERDRSRSEERRHYHLQQPHYRHELKRWKR
jgi:hypothetical protein